MDDKAAALVINLAKQFFELLRKIEPDFERAFYRFDAEPGSYGGRASVVTANGVSLIDSMRNCEAMQSLSKAGHDLITNFGKSRGVLLLSVRSDYEYNVQFEWDDLSRWNISKLNGGTGIPDGI